jgi:hypothetical protein
MLSEHVARLQRAAVPPSTSSDTRSVIREMVYFDALAPWTTAKCGETSRWPELTHSTGGFGGSSLNIAPTPAGRIRCDADGER